MGHLGLRPFVLGILVLLAVLCVTAAALPASVVYRLPVLGRRVALHRDLLLAGAAALVVGLVIGTALS